MEKNYVILQDPKEETVKKSSPPGAGKGADGKEKKTKKQKAGKKGRIGTVLKVVLCVFTLLAYVLVGVILACNVLLKGPSETMRNLLVLSAKQASATKWIPGLFLDEALVNEIEQGSKAVTYDVIDMNAVSPAGPEGIDPTDEWSDAVDGIRFIRITRPTFQAYLLIVQDPSRVFVGTGANYKAGATGGLRIFEVASKYNAVAAINGGEFRDEGGMGTGDKPMGITFSQGELVYNDGLTNRTFMGFTKDNVLYVSEGMTRAKADELGIRDGVCFQRGNSLITNDGSQLTVHYADGDTGTAQRTCIGQRADGAVLMLVTDGRTAASLGATHNDCIEILLEYGAVVAGKLDGGSSAMMYYRNYFDLYGYDQSELDQYQKQGMVNKYKAFTAPRRIPTYFIVGEVANNG